MDGADDMLLDIHVEFVVDGGLAKYTWHRVWYWMDHAGLVDLYKGNDSLCQSAIDEAAAWITVHGVEYYIVVVDCF